MKIKVSKVNKVNANGFYYPKAEMKKVIKKFNNEPDNLNHNIYLSREQARAHLDHDLDVVDIIGKVNKLELENDDIINIFNELCLESINITDTMYKKISEFLDEKENVKNYEILLTKMTT